MSAGFFIERMIINVRVYQLNLQLRNFTLQVLFFSAIWFSRFCIILILIIFILVFHTSLEALNYSNARYDCQQQQ